MTISATPISPFQDGYVSARINMIEGQIRTNRVTDERVINALRLVPRHIFVSDSLSSVAYVDNNLRIAPGRYLISPLSLARLIQESLPTPPDRALVIGAGTGYSAAVLSYLVSSVVALESDPQLIAVAQTATTSLGISNIRYQQGALEDGADAASPYDIILIDGMVDLVPPSIVAQLGEGGRLVTIQSGEGRNGAGYLMLKRRGAVSGRLLFDAASPLLPGFARPQTFQL